MSKEALKLALGALGLYARTLAPTETQKKGMEAITALDEALALALAHPQQEPVPTECRRDGRCQYAIDNGIEGLSLGFPQPAQPQQEPVAEDNSNYRLDPPGLDPRYTSPPAQRKPLTLGQKQRLWSSVGDKPTLKDRVNAYGLAIEAAHGIKENT